VSEKPLDFKLRLLKNDYKYFFPLFFYIFLFPSSYVLREVGDDFPNTASPAAVFVKSFSKENCAISLSSLAD